MSVCVFYSYFIPALFCRVGVIPFISSLAVGFIMVVASILLAFSIEKVHIMHICSCNYYICTVGACCAGTLQEPPSMATTWPHILDKHYNAVVVAKCCVILHHYGALVPLSPQYHKSIVIFFFFF